MKRKKPSNLKENTVQTILKKMQTISRKIPIITRKYKLYQGKYSTNLNKPSQVNQGITKDERGHGRTLIVLNEKLTSSFLQFLS